MPDPRREGEGGRGARTTAGSTGQRSGQGNTDDDRSPTEGTNRDFDEQEESKNQGHGHPREERGTKD